MTDKQKLTLVAVALGAAYLGFVVVAPSWRQRPAPAPASEEDGPSEPPPVDLAGVDFAVARAVESAREEVLRGPESAAAWGRLGTVLYVHEFAAAADACLGRAARLAPDEPRWPYFRGLNVALTDPGAAASHLRRAAEVCGDDPDVARLRLADLLLARGQRDEAAAHFRRLLRRYPDHARAHLGLGRVALLDGDLAAALRHLLQAAPDPRTRQAAHVQLAAAYQRRGDPGAADEALRRAAAARDAPWPDPFAEEAARLKAGRKHALVRAERLLADGKTDEAVALLRQTAHDYPDSDWAWLMLGKALVRRRDLPEATRALEEALRIAPDSVEAMFRKGVAVYLQDDVAGAAEWFRKAAARKPDFAMAHYNLGHCLARAGDRAAAVEAFRAAVQCSPTHADSHRMLGELLAQEGKRDEAAAHLRHAAELADSGRPALADP